MNYREVITARGHPNITATHKTTFQLTKDKELTKAGDCIIGIDADKGLGELSPQLKEHLLKEEKVVLELLLPQYGLREHVIGRGSTDLSFTHPSDIVVRKSSYTCGRTMVVDADKAAVDIDREMAHMLSDPTTEIKLIVVFNH